MNKIAKIVSWSLSIIVLIVLLAFSSKDNETVPLKEIVVKINTTEGNFFIAKEEIEEAIYDIGYQLELNAVNAVDVQELEAYFDKDPSIEKAEVYTSLDGKLTVDIEQRNPVLRVFTETGESYYVDENGWLMPLSDSYSSRVIMANGNIQAPYNLNYPYNISDKKLIKDIKGQQQLHALYQLAKHINESKFWNAQINQIYWNKEGDLELIPRVGNHRIIIGDESRLDKKLTKLMAFYKEGLNKTGWNDYSVINLKYKNQVVCTKK